MGLEVMIVDREQGSEPGQAGAAIGKRRLKKQKQRKSEMGSGMFQIVKMTGREKALVPGLADIWGDEAKQTSQGRVGVGELPKADPPELAVLRSTR